MPKRANPFGDYCGPMQLKIHVGTKEVNMGVNKEKNMKEVYDRTLEMLYSGQKTLNNQPEEVEMGECEAAANPSPAQQPTGASPPPKSHSPPGWFHGQYQLNAHGKLVYGSYPKQKVTQQVSHKILCGSCLNPNAPVHFICSYCEGNLCCGCRLVCNNCEDGFCSKCSVVNYEERCDRIFCLNCAQ